ncbi:hypothetical protein [Kocuria arenosa]|uniref:hypothetical protein n=1 Tax=Kocuria arenosa TaxID=3071446 RepID=UPI0034D52E40
MFVRITAEVTYDEAAVAALYSQLAGVLAGFAFAGILLIATERISASTVRSSNAREESLVLLLAAFLGLSINSLTYAVIGGEVETYERAAVMHVLAGGGFGISALTLLAAILILISDIAPRLSSWTRHAVGLGAPVVVSIYVASGLMQAENAIQPVELGTMISTWIAVAVTHVV